MYSFWLQIQFVFGNSWWIIRLDTVMVLWKGKKLQHKRDLTSVLGTLYMLDTTGVLSEVSLGEYEHLFDGICGDLSLYYQLESFFMLRWI